METDKGTICAHELLPRSLALFRKSLICLDLYERTFFHGCCVVKNLNEVLPRLWPSFLYPHNSTPYLRHPYQSVIPKYKFKKCQGVLKHAADTASFSYIGFRGMMRESLSLSVTADMTYVPPKRATAARSAESYYIMFAGVRAELRNRCSVR